MIQPLAYIHPQAVIAENVVISDQGRRKVIVIIDDRLILRKVMV